MTGLELALLAGGIGALTEGIAGGIGAMSKADAMKLSGAQRKRLRELQRREAENALGYSAAERELETTRAMTPVQAAEREAMARMGASQSIGDIGQGAAFRQQQALKSTAEQARTEAQRNLIAKEEMLRRSQQEELARLRNQQRQQKMYEDQIALSFLGPIGKGIAEGMGVAAKMEFAKEMYELQNPSAEDKNIVGSTANTLGVGSGAKATEGASLSGTNGLGQSGVGAGEAAMQNAKGSAFSVEELADIKRLFNGLLGTPLTPEEQMLYGQYGNTRNFPE